MRKYLYLRAIFAQGLIFAFLVNTFEPLPLAQADEFHLPVPGVMVHLSPEFNPPILKGIKVHPDNPFRFDFILDQGDSFVNPVIPAKAGIQNHDQLKQQSIKLIKYFLASLTIPENDLWVNLSPYEKNRIIPQSFGLTEMGRDLLAEDYMLKQITASLIYPEEETGKKFWKRIYEEASKRYGTTNIPVNTFNKVWIVPEKAVVYENAKAATAYVVESKLKVMLEQDYLSLQKHNIVSLRGAEGDEAIFKRTNNSDEIATRPTVVRNDTSSLGSQIIREIVIPELTKEVNENKNFAQLRQVYNSLILATWYKKKIKDSILEQVYADKNKTAGVQYTSTVIPAKAGIQFKNDVEGLYQEYLKAFKKGVYNYIKEEQDPLTQETMPRKYFSGGIVCKFGNLAMLISANPAMLPATSLQELKVTVNLAIPHLLVNNKIGRPKIAVRGVVHSSLIPQLTSRSKENLAMLSGQKVSVIIPTYNMGSSIEKAIKSVLNQSYQNFEIVIIDDGSTDDTEMVVKKLMQDDPRIEYKMNPKNQGRSVALNRALDIFRGDFVVTLDADDALPEKSLELRMKYLQEHPDVSFVYTATAIQFNGKTQSVKRAYQFQSTQELAEKQLWGPTVKVIPNSFMYRREIFRNKDHTKEIRFNPKALRAQDMILLFDLAKNGYKAGASDIEAYNFERGTHGTTAKMINRYRTFVTEIRVIKKYIKGPLKQLSYFMRIAALEFIKFVWELISKNKYIMQLTKGPAMANIEGDNTQSDQNYAMLRNEMAIQGNLVNTQDELQQAKSIMQIIDAERQKRGWSQARFSRELNRNIAWFSFLKTHDPPTVSALSEMMNKLEFGPEMQSEIYKLWLEKDGEEGLGGVMKRIRVVGLGGLTRKEFAEKVGHKEATIRNIEGNYYVPSAKIINKIDRTLKQMTGHKVDLRREIIDNDENGTYLIGIIEKAMEGRSEDLFTINEKTLWARGIIFPGTIRRIAPILGLDTEQLLRLRKQELLIRGLRKQELADSRGDEPASLVQEQHARLKKRQIMNNIKMIIQRLLDTDDPKQGLNALVFYLKTGIPFEQKGLLVNKIIESKIPLSNEEFDIFKFEFMNGSNLKDLSGVLDGSFSLDTIRKDAVKKLADSGILPKKTKDRILPYRSNNEIRNMILRIKNGNMNGLNYKILTEINELLENKAMNGGIDLTPAHMNLQMQNNDGEIKFHMDPAMLRQLQNAPGFVPVIINIQPMNDLREFLGIDEAVR